MAATNDTVVKFLAEGDLLLRMGQVEKDWKGVQTKIKTGFAETVAEATAAGLKVANLKPIVGKFHKLNDELNASTTKALELQATIQERTAKGIQADELKALLVQEQLRLKGLESRSKRELSATNMMIERRKKGLQEAERLAGRTRGEVAEEFGEGIKDAFEDLKGGNFSGLLKKIGAGTESRGLGMQAKAAEGGMGSKLLGSMGGLMAKIGPMVAAVAAVAAGFAAVAKIIIDADAQAKELNRTLLDGGIAGNDLADAFGSVEGRLQTLREASLDPKMWKWGTTAKENLEIIKSFDEVGVGFKQLTAGAQSSDEEMQKLQGSMEGALTYSKLLGMTANEVAVSMGTYMEDLGLSQEGVLARFGAITAAAKESGFSTKRFFNMILQATTGMSMYNVRIEEAAGLLIHLGKILGEKMGGDFLQNLTKGFKDEGTLDRVKKTLTTGVGRSLSILTEDASRTTGEFLRKLQETSVEAKTAFQDALGRAGIKEDIDTLAKDPAMLAKKFASMSMTQQNSLRTAAEASGNPALVRMLSEAMGKASAFKGGLRGAQAARQYAGPGAALMLQLDELQGVLGKRVDQIDMTNIEERAAFENITGRSGEAALQLQEVGKRFAGYNDELARVQTQIKKAGPGTAAAQSIADEFNRVMGKEIGVVLSGAGERFRALKDKEGEYDKGATEEAIRTGKGVKVEDTFQSLIMGLGEELRGLEAVDANLATAKEIASNTTDITKVLEQGVQWVLEKIYTSVEYIASWMGFGKSGQAVEDKTRRFAMAKLSDELGSLNKKMTEKKRAIKKAETPEEKKRLESELLGAELEYGDKSAQLREIQARAGEQTGIQTTEDWLNSSKLWANGGVAAGGPAQMVNTVAGVAPSWKTPQYQPTHFDQFRSPGASLLGKTPDMTNLADRMAADAVNGPTVSLSAADQRADDERLREQTGVVKSTTTEQTKALVREMQAQGSSDRERKVAAALFGAGGLTADQAQRLAKGVVGGGPVDPALKAKLTEEVSPPGAPEGAPKKTRAGWLMEQTGEAMAHDYLLQVGEGGRVKFSQRIDSADQVTAVASKPGGALSRGAGGAQVVHNHFYNDGKGIFASMKKWQQANGQG